jgi:hypothetical protein
MGEGSLGPGYPSASDLTAAAANAILLFPNMEHAIARRMLKRFHRLLIKFAGNHKEFD